VVGGELSEIGSRHVAFIRNVMNGTPDFLYGTDLMSVTRLVEGRGGNVNRMIEKELSFVATTRNWNTIERELHE